MSPVRGPSARRYAILLAVQTLCAAVVLFNIHASFRLLIENIGTPHLSTRLSIVQLLLAAALGQACYWYRLHRVALPPIRRNLPIGHLLAFASRIGFIFGSALFSVYFLRHAPVVDLSTADLVWRGTLLLAILFALYCYTLELERLGAALQAPPSA
ncbi:hypothetical protein ACFPN9_06530 [Bosea massiliensis]|uniref:Uncharacterized protein n=1 Tax=Bosea massiliensis TaxID=151419 RepID=A0ABW0NYL8_9HYPH|nr:MULTISPECIES: hypothetical protein [Hyphomicrobiales]